MTASAVEPRLHGMSAKHVDAARRIGCTLRQYRREAGLTLRQIGEAIGVSFVQVQRFESGASPLSVTRLLAICDILNISPAGLLSGTAGRQEMQADREANELSHFFASVSAPRDRQVILELARSAAARAAFYQGDDLSKPEPFNQTRSHEGISQ